nr:hypothetical protein [Tanacetum cinerariifolium]
MVVAAIKHMASNFAKLDKFEGVDFRRWQKKMHFFLLSISVVYVLTTTILEDGGDDATDSLEAKYMAEDASSKKFLVSNFTNYIMTHSRLVMEQYNELLGILRRVQDSDKPKGNNIIGPLVFNMVEHKNSSRDCKGVNVSDKANGSGTKGSVDGSSNLLKGATVHVCKDRCWFKTYESLNDGSILYMENESTTWVHGSGLKILAFMSNSKLNDSILWHARLGMSNLRG